jgi:hypothetical protein
MDDENIDIADALIIDTISPALWEDFTYSNEEEFKAIKHYLIEAIREVEYVDQSVDEEYEYEE